MRLGACRACGTEVIGGEYVEPRGTVADTDQVLPARHARDPPRIVRSAAGDGEPCRGHLDPGPLSGCGRHDLPDHPRLRRTRVRQYRRPEDRRVGTHRSTVALALRRRPVAVSPPGGQAAPGGNAGSPRRCRTVKLRACWSALRSERAGSASASLLAAASASASA